MSTPPMRMFWSPNSRVSPNLHRVRWLGGALQSGAEWLKIDLGAGFARITAICLGGSFWFGLLGKVPHLQRSADQRRAKRVGNEARRRIGRSEVGPDSDDTSVGTAARDGTEIRLQATEGTDWLNRGQLAESFDTRKHGVFSHDELPSEKGSWPSVVKESLIPGTAAEANEAASDGYSISGAGCIAAHEVKGEAGWNHGP